LTRSSASLKLMTFQIAFKYCRIPNKHHARMVPGQRKRRRERDEGMKTRDEQVSAGTQSFSIPGSDDDEERRWTKRHGGIRSKTHIGLDVLVLQVEPVRRAQKKYDAHISPGSQYNREPHRHPVRIQPSQKKEETHTHAPKYRSR
jgi:hypothetical protein